MPAVSAEFAVFALFAEFARATDSFGALLVICLFAWARPIFLTTRFSFLLRADVATFANAGTTTAAVSAMIETTSAGLVCLMRGMGSLRWSIVENRINLQALRS
ncbi:MAG TPA: hypothetical protein VFZ41_02740 [Solirubrobacterales bacterium]